MAVGWREAQVDLIGQVANRRLETRAFVAFRRRLKGVAIRRHSWLAVATADGLESAVN